MTLSAKPYPNTLLFGVFDQNTFKNWIFQRSKIKQKFLKF